MKKKIKLVINKASSFVAPLFNQPKKHLKTWLVIFLALTAGLAVLFFLLSPRATEAAWWDETWLYRKAVQISNSNGADLTDFQVAITLDTVSLITAGKMQDDCDDLRITDGNGNIIPHWIEENNPGCNNSATKIWTKVPTVFDGTDATTIYAYYGNSQAENAENGDNVFEFFDDFESYQIGQAPSGYTVLAGSGTASIQEVAGTKVLQFSAESNSHLIKDNLSLADIRLYTSANSVSGSYAAFFVRGQNTSARNYYVWNLGNGTTIKRYYRYVNDGVYNITSVNESWNQGQFYPLSIKAVGNNITFYDGNTQKGTITWTDFSSGSIGIHMGGSNITQQFRYFFACKGVITDPTTSLNTEETSAGPVAYWKFDEGTGTTAYDSSGQGNDGTLVNGSTWQTEDMCISGKCLGFDGTDDVVTISNSVGNIKTVSFWVKPITTSEQFIGLNDSAYIQSSSGTISATGFASPTIYVNGKVSSTIEANKWQHVVVTTNTAVSGSAIKIAQISTNYGQIFIDEVKIYPYARTSDQIKSDYIAGASLKGSSAVFGHKTETAPITPLASKLVAYWKFDEGYGTTAHDSVGANHGTLAAGDAAPTWTNEGKFGKALSFDGDDDYLAIDNITLTTEWALSFWAIPKNASSFQGVVGSNTGNYLNLESDIIHYRGNSNHYTSYSATGQWQHFVLTRGSDGTVRVYVDKEKLDSYSDSDESFNIDLIGTFWDSSDYTFEGELDEFKIYNYALSEDEVRQDYNQGMAAVMGQSSANTDSTAPGGSAAQEYCVPGSTDTCRPPVAEWNFEENTGTIAHDTSGNGNDGTITGASWAKGVNGGAGLRFDGGDQISCGDADNGISTELTISLWVRPNNGYGTGVNPGIISKRNGSWGGLWVNQSSGKIWGRLYQSNGTQINLPQSYTLTTNEWSYITMIASATTNTFKLYVNTIEKASASYDGTILNGEDSLLIGKQLSDAFNGVIDEVKIYNYARTPAQIAWDYNRGAPVGHWRFDECEGTVAHDVSGNENHGTINIGATAPQTAAGTCQILGTAWGNGASGKLNYSLSFDGVDDYVAVGNTGRTDIATLSFWAKPASTTQKIIELSASDSVEISAGTVAVTGFGTEKIYIDGVEASSFADTNWHHITVVSSVGLTANAMNIGKVGTNYYSGLIDDVRIYNYALTPLQIKTLYNDGAVRFGE